MDTEYTKEEVEAAYKVARRLATMVLNRVRSSHDHILDYDDFVQEGMLAWLEGRPMYESMIRAFTNSAKISNYSYKVKGVREPVTLSLDNMNDSEHPGENPYESLENKIDMNKILSRILEIKDEQAQFAVLAYFFFGMSLRQLGEVFEKSHEWVRTYLIEPELAKLREEFKC